MTIIQKAVVIIVGTFLFISIIYSSLGWWLAAHDRDEFKAAFEKERGISQTLRESIGEQNAAIDAMAEAALEAQESGAKAKEKADTKGRQYDAARAKLDEAKASTCDEAMPAVRQMIKDVK